MIRAMAALRDRPVSPDLSAPPARGACAQCLMRRARTIIGEQIGVRDKRNERFPRTGPMGHEHIDRDQEISGAAPVRAQDIAENGLDSSPLSSRSCDQASSAMSPDAAEYSGA